MYSNILKKSALQLKHNPILFVPDILYFALTLLFGYIAARSSGILTFFEQATDVTTASAVQELISAYAAQNLTAFLIAFGTFIVVTFFIGVSLKAVKLDMIKQIMHNKQPSIMQAWNDHLQYYWSIVGIKLLIFIIYAVLILFVTLITLTLFKGPEAVVYFMLPLFILYVLITLFFFYAYPILFHTKNSAMYALKTSYKLFKQHKKFTFLIFLLAAAIGALGNLITQALADFYNVLVILQLLWGLAVGIWIDVVTFGAYHVKKKSKK